MRYFYLLLICRGVVFGQSTGGASEFQQEEERSCVVFVCNKKYVEKFKNTYHQLRGVGGYTGEVCLVATGDLVDEDVQDFFIEDHLHHIVRFPEIQLEERTKRRAMKPLLVAAQIQKLHLFNTYFKKWDYIYYIDCGMNIHDDVSLVFNMREKGMIVGYSTMHSHTGEFFDDGSRGHKFLHRLYGLKKRYFLSGLMLYDTSIIEENTFDDLISLLRLFPFGRGDQSFISLYFCHIHPKWKALTPYDEDYYYYDFAPKGEDRHYVMHKYHMQPYKCPYCDLESSVYSPY